ncbi:MAG: hypothetical protein CL678_07720, partial [Bdellovibrionaceae bacterium]|nr:hypothetical protein [Pseudobdellovibrionaceae bacterium]
MIKFFCFFIFFIGTTGLCDVLDSRGKSFEEKEYKRIITLTPGIAEQVCDLLENNLGSIVGVVEYTNFPRPLLKKAKVGSYSSLSLERIVQLKPDLIIGTRQGNPRKQIQKLESLGFTVFILDINTVKELNHSYSLLGKLLKKEKIASVWIEKINKAVQSFQKRNESKKKKGLIQVGFSPLIAMTKNSFLGELLSFIGIESIFKSTHSYIRPSLERVVSLDPDFILIFGMNKNLKIKNQEIAYWK